jgi:hypothetical protein
VKAEAAVVRTRTVHLNLVMSEVEFNYLRDLLEDAIDSDTSDDIQHLAADLRRQTDEAAKNLEKP